MKRNELLAFLADYLAVAKVQDYGPNGLQVEGREEIRTVVTGVSACLELFERAVQLGADAVMVHHGLFWHGQDATVRGAMKRRLKLLLENEINLLAYHLPLDKHPEVGNNALAARALGLRDWQPFAEVGVIGERDPILGSGLVEQVAELYGRQPLAFAYGPEKVSRVAILSGSGAKYVTEAIERGADAYITGEPAEYVMNLAREAGIHFLAAGHYATERLGIRALGEKLAADFGLNVTFVDVPNPV